MNRYQEELENLRKAKNLRSLSANLSADLVNLSSNDYLALNDASEIQQAFKETPEFRDLSFSASSTRLLTGNINQYTKLENQLALLFGTESALVFSSGYHANMGILPALTGKDDLIIADKEVHASIIDAMQLGKAAMRRYKHMDLAHLERILDETRGQYDQVFIVTESVFSMDGLTPDLHKLIEIKEKHDAFIFLDEAHAFGVYGEKGLGKAEEEGVISKIDFIVGTFGKSLASLGAFVVCNNLFRQYLVNKSRSLIYTTGLPPINLAWTTFLLEKLPEFSDKRKHINCLSNQLSDALGVAASSHVIPYVQGSNEKVIRFATYMQENGFYVLPIRHPTVPKGTERIRFSIKADLTLDQLTPIKQLVSQYNASMVE
jgi:8-amino-7-oxononanoate synthase